MSASAVPGPITKSVEPDFSSAVRIHRTNADFWKKYGDLPADIRGRADTNSRR